MLMIRPDKISVQGPWRGIRMGSLPPGNPHNQGCDIWRCRHMSIILMGTTRSWCMAPWAIQGPLPMQSIWLDWPIPPTLDCASLHSCNTHCRTFQWTAGNTGGHATHCAYHPNYHQQRGSALQKNMLQNLSPPTARLLYGGPTTLPFCADLEIG